MRAPWQCGPLGKVPTGIWFRKHHAPTMVKGRFSAPICATCRTAVGRGRVKIRPCSSLEEQRRTRSSQERFSRPRQWSKDPGNSALAAFSHTLGHKQPLAGVCFAASQAPQSFRGTNASKADSAALICQKQDYLAASVRSKLDSSHEISEDLSRVCGSVHLSCTLTLSCCTVMSPIS